MSEQQEQELDALSGMVIRKAGLENPPERLTSNIMSAIYAENTYRPVNGLLTKKSKITISGCIVCICVGISFLPQTKEIWEVSGVLAQLTGYLEHISNLIPKTFLYGSVVFGLVVFLQVAYLKKHIKSH